MKLFKHEVGSIKFVNVEDVPKRKDGLELDMAEDPVGLIMPLQGI